MTWWTGPVVCAVCDHRHIMVIEIEDAAEEPPMGCECPACGSMACIPVTEPTDETEEMP